MVQWSDELTPERPRENGDTLMCHLTQYMLAILAIICCSAETAVGQLPVERAWDNSPVIDTVKTWRDYWPSSERDRGDGNTSAPGGDCRAPRAAAASAGHDASRPAVHLSATAADRDTGRDPAALTTPAIIRHLSDGALCNRRYPRPGIDRHAARRWINSRAMRWRASIDVLGAKRDTGCVERLTQLAEAADEPVRPGRSARIGQHRR